jgi:ribosome biogenesis protein YTM1
MSGAYDGSVRIWDLRSAKVPVASFKNEKGGKILSVDWGKGVGALGGENGVEVWKINEGGDVVQ